MEPIGIVKGGTLAIKAGATLYDFYNSYKKDRYGDFIQCLDVTYESGSIEARNNLNEFIENPTGRAILGERLESIMSTDSKRVLMIQALLLCKDRDCWPGEAIEKRIIFALQNMTDETINIFQFCLRLRKIESSLNYNFLIFNQETDLSSLDQISDRRVMVIIEDLKRRGLFLPDIRDNGGMNFYQPEEQSWDIVFGITEEAEALSKLINKAELLLT